MSLSKRIMENELQNQDLVNALEVLLDNERIDHDASKGIAKKIISDKGLGKLSEKQLYVFEKHLTPLLQPTCEEFDCGGTIELFHIPDAYSNEFEEGGLYCENCLYNRLKIKAMK